ncbi:MAG: InlB B-repeat-containing protein, partial [Clostridia bacterium]|nr:InlB B-repeat-containing protein [Clostridia bacterium]
KVTISADRPERDGYRFINWNSKIDGSGKIYTGSATYSDNASIVLYAQWDANAYKLRFDANGGYCSSDGITIDFGQPFGDLPVPTYPGYDFEGWYTLKEGGELVQPNHTFPTANNLIVYAHWVPIIYQVDFDGNGYDGEGALPETQYKKFNESIILRMNSPQMAGGKFIEWNTEPDGSGTTYTDGARYGTNANLTLFAVWDRVKYTVTFDANSGTGAPQAIIKEHGLETVLPDTIPTRYGYSFEYWNTRPDGMGTPYYPGGTYNENGNKTLYAIWVAGPFTVRYNGCGGSISASSMNYVFDSPYGTMPTAEKVGYDFLGWFSEENGGEIVNSQDKVGKYSILYAHWKAKTYTLNFDANGGSISQASKTVTYDSEIGELPVPVKQGYIFSGWFNEKGRQFKPESIVKFNADQNLTARWAPSHYVVYFDPAGGSCDRAYMSVQSGSAYGSLPVPSREGFRFTGWYDGETAVTESRIFTCAKDLTLKAKWEFTGTVAPSEDSYTVTFVSGDASQSLTVKCGDEIQLPVPAEREGKTFTGWYPEVPYTVENEDLTFTAAYINDIWFAEFIADGAVAAAEEYTANTLSVSEPSVPEKPGYYGNWDAYSLVPGGTVVFADYTPVIYTATFVTGGEVIATVTYTVEDEGIEEPQVPYRSGYTGRWAEYTLIPGGITVVAVYDLDVGGITISIGDSVSSKPFEADYRSAVRIIPRVSKSISVTEIRWYIDGEYDSTGGEYYVKDVRKGFKVRADLCYKDKVIATSGEKQIKINSGFIQRVIAFFKALFDNLPTKTIS